MEKHIDIQKDVVTFQQAIDLCVLGFNEKTLCAYEIENQELYLCHLDEEGLYMPDKDILAPTKSQVFRWFRKKYKWVSIIFNDDGDIEYGNIRFNYEIRVMTFSFKDLTNEENACVGQRDYKTYEEAENACINKLIELAKRHDS